jgi:hypothetical protein
MSTAEAATAASASVSTSIAARERTLESLAAVIAYVSDDIQFSCDGSPWIDHICPHVRLLEKLRAALITGRYALVERTVLERIVESADCIQALLICGDSNHERDEE